MEVPCCFSGLVLRQSPSVFHFGTYQSRFFVLQRGWLYWSASEGTIRADGPVGCVGRIDFSANPCEVKPDAQSTTIFYLRPKGDSWLKADFNGADTGRIFRFDAGKSDHARDAWMAAFRAHIDFARANSRTLHGGRADLHSHAPCVGYHQREAIDAHASRRSSQESSAASQPEFASQHPAEPVIRDATPDEITASLAGSIATGETAEEEEAAEEIQCD